MNNVAEIFTSAAVPDLRQMLIDSVEYQAEWRDQKAADYPGDARNQRSADSLRRLHARLLALPANHSIWTRYGVAFDRLADAHDGVPSEIESEQLRAYGFYDGEGGDPIEFVTNLVRQFDEWRKA